MIAYVPAICLPESRLDPLLRYGMDIALESGYQVVVLGLTWPEGRPALCTCGCAINTPGGAVLVPDVLVLQGIANGRSVDTEVLTRDDGRSVLMYQTRSR